MNNKQGKMPECPFPNPEVWNDSNFAAFKSAGAYKMAHLSKAQKSDLFLAFMLRHENKGICGKIAKFFEMHQTNLFRMVQHLEEYQKFVKAEHASGILSHSNIPKRNVEDMAVKTKMSSGHDNEDCSQGERAMLDMSIVYSSKIAAMSLPSIQLCHSQLFIIFMWLCRQTCGCADRKWNSSMGRRPSPLRRLLLRLSPLRPSSSCR